MGATKYMPKNQSFPEEAGVVSLLHPVLPTTLEAKASKGSMVATIKQPVAHWIAQGIILTDGTQAKCRVYPEDDGHHVGCAYDRNHLSGMFGGLQDYLDGKLFNPSSDDSMTRG